MATRPTMSDLIEVVRRKSGDLAGSKQVFDDSDIQDMLDRRRRDVRYGGLDVAETIMPNGAILYTSFHDPSGYGYWEADAFLSDGSWQTIIPDSANLVAGIWTFDPGLTNPSVFVTGQQFDVNAATADLLEEWLSRVKREYSYSSAGRSYQRGEQIAAFAEAIERFRSRSWVLTSTIEDRSNYPSRRSYVGYDGF